MTAGKGIYHAEMPASATEASIGFQLWINLKSELKFIEPAYQEFLSKDIPIYKDEQIEAKVIAGEVLGIKGPITARTPAYFIDFTLAKDKTYEHQIPAGWNSLIVVHSGSLKIQDSKVVPSGQSVKFVLNKSSDEVLKFTSLEDGTRFILLAGTPMNEPIARYGPFVLNTEQQIEECMDDFNLGRNGFEGGR